MEQVIYPVVVMISENAIIEKSNDQELGAYVRNLYYSNSHKIDIYAESTTEIEHLTESNN